MTGDAVKNTPNGRASEGAVCIPMPQQSAPPATTALTPIAAAPRQPAAAACSAPGIIGSSSSGKQPCAPYGGCSCRQCVKKNGVQREDSNTRIDAMGDGLVDFYNKLDAKTYSELYAKLKQAIDILGEEKEELVEDVSNSVAEAIFLALEEGDLDE
jgi:hypothetical protein